ncbi:MAG: methylmalonyl-CoA epimerase [Desulfuromonadaceae bacterium]|nr:methylmalonyl-CoA epimerase [Desulfuromonadaceae bacterium]MDD2847658.1 methylmalonyl-CoA epimerase [Desulfuromonadaceae bacterium]MDD4131096.1 methylmalonyl-CoA epimerase [Desulfuromonadaceae bacterium]
MLTKINHIGVAVKSLNDTIPFYQDTLGMTLAGIEEVSEQKVRVAMLQIGESMIELLEPTSAESPIATFIDKNGCGIHHIAYEVDDIEKVIAKLLGEGARMIDEKPRQGAHGTSIAFIHPKSSNGVLTELCQAGH